MSAVVDVDEHGACSALQHPGGPTPAPAPTPVRPSFKLCVTDPKTFGGHWITCCTDVAEMMFVLERASGRHRNIGEPLVVYNKDNSVRYPNSYYNLARSGAAQRRLHRELLQKYAPGMLRRR